jgi:hypothetical protein
MSPPPPTHTNSSHPPTIHLFLSPIAGNPWSQTPDRAGGPGGCSPGVLGHSAGWLPFLSPVLFSGKTSGKSMDWGSDRDHFQMGSAASQLGCFERVAAGFLTWEWSRRTQSQVTVRCKESGLGRPLVHLCPDSVPHRIPAMSSLSSRLGTASSASLRPWAWQAWVWCLFSCIHRQETRVRVILKGEGKLELGTVPSISFFPSPWIIGLSPEVGRWEGLT